MRLASAHAFLDKVFKNLADSRVDVTGYELDHLCYRVTTLEEYAACKNEFAKVATLLHEAQISGRPIATYILNAPIEYKGRKISCIELPAPKAGKPTATGWEHVEFVIDEGFEDFIRRHPHVTFDTSGAKKSHNPELAVVFEDCVVKFHHIALETAVRRELAKIK